MTYSEEYIKDRIKELQSLMTFELQNQNFNTFILNTKVLELDQEIQTLQNACSHSQPMTIYEINNIRMETCPICDKTIDAVINK